VPVLLVLGSMTSLQFGAAIATHLFDDIGAAGASALRLGLSAVVLLVIGRPRVRTWTSAQRRSVALLGLSMAAMNTSFYEAVSRIPLGAAITIEFLGPLGLAAVLSRRWREGLWVALAFGGVLVLGLTQESGGGRLDPVGVAAAAVAGVFWAAYVVAGSRVAVAGPDRGGLAAACTVAALCVVPYGLAVAGRHLVGTRVLGLGFVMAVLASVVPYSFELRALERMAKKTFSVLVALEPAIGALVGFAVLGQRLRPFALVGVALVVAAGIGATSSASDAEEPVLAPGSS
jgi:inner membrane transporter RhtA